MANEAITETRHKLDEFFRMIAAHIDADNHINNLEEENK